MTVADSILPYGNEIWADDEMASVQQRRVLRIANSYRTISEPAVVMIAGVTPIDLLDQEKK